MSSFRVYLDGRRISDKIAFGKIRTDGIGLFESLRTYGGKIFREDEHLDRLFESAKTSGFSLMPDRREIKAALKKAVTAFKKERCEPDLDVFVRLTVLPEKIFVFVGERKHPPKIYEKGVSLKTSPVRRSFSNAAFPETKTSAYQNAVLASLEKGMTQTYEWVFLDREGFVTEVRIGNLFMVKSRKHCGRFPEDFWLLTPPSWGILNGITRRLVIECALQSGIGAKEIPLMRHDIYNAREAFLTNTSWEILPVKELDGRSIGHDVPGPVTKILQKRLRKRIEDECL
ncbi:MAG: aminotransferase class IV family protein [Candidatus Omnitrophica bacterium]|nr:aminotransferase class IV family protein [Candidatus Omnitrophota bacterium]